MPSFLRLWPRSLLWQTLLAVAIALFVTQFVAGALLYRAAEQRQEAALINAAGVALIGGPRERRAPPNRRGRPRIGGAELGNDDLALGNAPRRPPRPLLRRLRYQRTAEFPILQDEKRFPGREAALQELLIDQGIAPHEVAITQRPLKRDPTVLAELADRPLLRERLNEFPAQILVAAMRRTADGPWETARVPVRGTNGANRAILIGQSLLLFAVLMAVLYFVLRRITGPLSDLTARTTSFAEDAEASAPLVPRGPSDIAALTRAHNRMETRISAMLDEKDVMLGAIGHDLKTPLAALRVRVESVKDDAQRTKMSETIADISKTLDEILDLARIGRSGSEPENAELKALARSVVEEFEDMGSPVAFAEMSEQADPVSEPKRITAPLHLTWIKRGLRNLISNALRYGETARVSVLLDGNHAVLRIDDQGPGIPEAEMANMLEPFVRGEASRNRATGGAGLGLTIARAVAEKHDGKLVLSNLTASDSASNDLAPSDLALSDLGKAPAQIIGLRAELRLPIG